jgi:glycosyltransferase involved in cell wall biosynthesis
MTAEKPSITAIILSFNEEVHIARCIERLWPVVQRIVVVDSFSTDRTVEIARSLGAEVLQNKWKNYAAQFQWGVDNAHIATDWTMRVDCDEYLEDGLKQTILRELPVLPDTVTACDFKLKVIFQGKFIRWGGYYNTVLTRLWRTGIGQIEQRWMDEHIVIAHGDRKRLHGGDLVDENLKDITWWTEKHNGYATRQMIDFISLEQPLFEVDTRIRNDRNRTAKWKRFLRNIVYAGTPLYLRAVLYFLQRYFLRLGFLDGKKGFVWHFLQGFWFFVLMDAKVDEARTFIRLHGLEAFKHHLANRYGVTELAPVDAARLPATQTQA